MLVTLYAEHLVAATEGKVSGTFMALGRFGASGVDRMTPKVPGGTGALPKPPIK